MTVVFHHENALGVDHYTSYHPRVVSDGIGRRQFVSLHYIAQDCDKCKYFFRFTARVTLSQLNVVLNVCRNIQPVHLQEVYTHQIRM